MAYDVKISVSLENEDGGEIIDFKASDVLKHNGETRTWAELGADPHHQFAQESLAEDYALWIYARQHGDERSYEVNIVDQVSIIV